MHETKATIRLRKRAGHAVLQGVALSRGVAIGGAAEVWAGGRPMAIRRRKRGTDATAGGWEPEIMISEAKDSQARSSTLSARFFLKKASIIGASCVAWDAAPYPSCREKLAFVIFLCIIHRRILLLQKYIYYYLVMRVCSYLCVLNFLDDLDRWY
jgi:hypothetical protein